MMKSSVLTFAIYFISFLLLLILWRRYVIVRQSGGNFFAPFHIAKGRFYIHNAYVFRKRIIPLNNIKKIEVDFIPSVNTLRKSNSNLVNVALPYSSTACG